VADEEPPQGQGIRQAEVRVSGGGRVQVTGSVERKAEQANPPPAPKDRLEADRRQVGVDRARSDLKLSKWVGYGALVLLAVQIAVADKAFFDYGHAYGWKIPVTAISAWLAAIVIQVVGVVLVIAHYLFPPNGDGGG
jgi:hypothetical protein